MRIRGVVSACAGLWLLVAGCQENTGVLPGNLPPRTYLNIVGADLDTTDYRKVLSWWGTDPDGEVSGYLIRWDGGWQIPPGSERTYGGLHYSFTTATRDTFPVPLGGSFAERTFTVRAVDDQDSVDPVGVSQTYSLSNHPPTLSWDPDLRRPTVSLPAAAFGFNASDFDGRRTVNSFRIWLDGDSARARITSDTLIALGPADFGDETDRERTVFVQAIDDAQATSNVISHTWRVEEPAGEWLLLDAVTGPGASTWDAPFYRAVLDSVVHGDLHTIDMINGADFATEVEIEPLFSLFRGVAWLTGPYVASNDQKMARNLDVAARGMRAYVEQGGRILLIGQTLVGSEGGLPRDFVGDILGIATIYEDRRTGLTDLPLRREYSVRFERGGLLDSLDVYTTSLQVDYYTEPAPPSRGIYWVPPGVLDRMMGESAPVPPQDENAYLGVVRDFGSGRTGIITAPYARLFDYRNEPERIEEAVRLFREVLLP